MDSHWVQTLWQQIFSLVHMQLLQFHINYFWKVSVGFFFTFIQQGDITFIKSDTVKTFYNVAKGYSFK